MILVYDWETTGLTLHPDADPRKQPQAIEFGGAYLSPSSGRIIEEFSFLIKPDDPITEEITKITGITNADLQYQPSFKHRLPEIRRIFAGATCGIAHNEPFDRAILRGELVRLGLNPDADFHWPAKRLCTVGLYREQWGRNPKLIELYESIMGKKYEHSSDQVPSNEILERAGEQQAPINLQPTPGLNLDSTGSSTTPDSTK